jgi:Kelch motif protein
LTTLTAADNWPQNANGITLPGGAAVLNNRLYVFGGFEIGIGMISTIWEFNPAAAVGSRWTLKTATLPAPRGYIPTAASGSFIYMAGGSAFVAGTLEDTNQSLRYDPATDTITTIATTPRATAETRAVRHPFDNTIWVLGGGRVPPNPSTQIDVYNPATDTWSPASGGAPPMLTARRNFAADIDPTDGRIWAAGGYDAGALPLNVNEQFLCPVPVELMTFGVE